MQRRNFFAKLAIGTMAVSISPTLIAQSVTPPALPTPAVPLSPVRAFDEAHPLVGLVKVEALGEAEKVKVKGQWSTFLLPVIGWQVKAVSRDGYALVGRIGATDYKEAKVLPVSEVKQWHRMA